MMNKDQLLKETIANCDAWAKEAISLRSQLSAAEVRVSDLEAQLSSREERIKELLDHICERKEFDEQLVENEAQRQFKLREQAEARVKELEKQLEIHTVEVTPEAAAITIELNNQLAAQLKAAREVIGACEQGFNDTLQDGGIRKWQEAQEKLEAYRQQHGKEE